MIFYLISISNYYTTFHQVLTEYWNGTIAKGFILSIYANSLEKRSQKSLKSTPCNRDLTNYGQREVLNDIQDVGFLAKCGCIMNTTIFY
jgi:hypothetical protein